MDIVAQFDPSIQPIPNVNANIPHNGKIVFYNESNIGLKLTFSDGVTDILAPWTAQVYCLGAIPSPQIQFAQAYVLVSTGAPVSLVIGIRYMPNEKVHGTFPIALARQTNVGNAINTVTTTNQVTNDGNPIVTTFIEATQVGNASGSNVAMGNDGSFAFAQFVSSAYQMYLQGVPGATPNLRYGKKLIVQAVDNNGANNSNILGIDSGGNLFLQNHSTNNQTVIYDKNGNAIATFDANKCIDAIGTTQSVNGDTSGSMSIDEVWTGTIKIVQLRQNNYRQAGAAQLVTLKNAFTFLAGIFNFGCAGIVVATGNVIANIGEVTWGTGTSAGSNASTTQMQIDCAGFSSGAFTQVGSNGGAGVAHTGIAFYIGT